MLPKGIKIKKGSCGSNCNRFDFQLLGLNHFITTALDYDLNF